MPGTVARPTPDAAPAPAAPVAEAVEELGRLADLPVGEHVAVFEAVHDSLRARLDDTGA
ncbi:hypothetical protein [Sanguibacter suaedae]|uniref:Uncharacterized protein n=1 Tax=Sanguibacter suaedae TaxID=2795737 RepID=A0A934MB44_9MICO|nr:hypothetical protein [Sanguibacter suaedae]MBI9116275.1 hypothetical protein [Sanguibacter suaedae]